MVDEGMEMDLAYPTFAPRWSEVQVTLRGWDGMGRTRLWVEWRRGREAVDEVGAFVFVWEELGERQARIQM